MARKKSTKQNDVIIDEVVTIVYNDNASVDVLENDIIETEDDIQEEYIAEEEKEVKTEVVTEEVICEEDKDVKIEVVTEEVICEEENTNNDEQENVVLFEDKKEEKIIEIPKEPEVKKTNTNKNKCRFTFGYIWNGQEFDF